MIPIHKKYFDNYKKIFVHTLNNVWNEKNEKNEKNENNDVKDIVYKLKKYDNVEDVDDVEDVDNVDNVDNVDDVEVDYKQVSFKLLQDKQNQNIKIETNELNHLNINHLESSNDFVDGYDKLELEINKISEFMKKIKEIYLDQTEELKSNGDTRYKIISETTKIELDVGTKQIQVSETDDNKYISTTLLNPWKLYDGMTNLSILMDNSKYAIEDIKIRTRAKNSNDNIYRNIEWDLEFEECEEGYRILGLDNFIHIGLVGLEEIFLDIVYDICIDELDISEKNNFGWLGWFGWLKFTQCYYNEIIKQNLRSNLYTNEESYSVDIIDYIWIEKINLQKEEQMFGNIYDTNYEILRIMSGMRGIKYSY
jgi:hypothetical protein